MDNDEIYHYENLKSLRIHTEMLFSSSSGIHTASLLSDCLPNSYNKADKSNIFLNSHLSLIIKPSHEKTDLSVVQFEILRTRMRSLWNRSEVWLFAWSFLFIPILCGRTAKALARLRACTGSPEPSLVAYVISTFLTWAGSSIVLLSWRRR